MVHEVASASRGSVPVKLPCATHTWVLGNQPRDAGLQLFPDGARRGGAVDDGGTSRVRNSGHGCATKHLLPQRDREVWRGGDAWQRGPHVPSCERRSRTRDPSHGHASCTNAAVTTSTHNKDACSNGTATHAQAILRWRGLRRYLRPPPARQKGLPPGVATAAPPSWLVRALRRQRPGGRAGGVPGGSFGCMLAHRCVGGARTAASPLRAHFAQALNKGSKLLNFINSRMRVTISDS